MVKHGNKAERGFGLLARVVHRSSAASLDRARVKKWFRNCKNCLHNKKHLKHMLFCRPYSWDFQTFFKDNLVNFKLVTFYNEPFRSKEH